MQQDPNSRAPKKCIYEAHDADEQAENLTNWQQRYDQISAGRFFGSIEEVPLASLQIFKEQTSHSLRQQCKVWPDSIWLGIPVHRGQSSAPKINGLSVEPNQLMVRPGSVDFELVTPESFDIYGIVVKQEALLHAAQCQGISLNSITEGQPRLAINPLQANNLVLLVERVLNAQYEQLGAKVPALLKADLILHSLLDALKEPVQTLAAPPSYNHRKLVVERVKAYVDQHPGSTITMTQLCELAHVSRRTLQYSFESILGISPLQYIRMSRLNQVRRQLLFAGEGTLVSDVAAQWGFWHPGQFSKDYKQLFGEMPSETLHHGLQSHKSGR